MDILIEKIKQKNNPTVVGLDPLLDYVPNFIKEKAFKEYGKNLKGASNAILEFNKGLIDALYDVIPAIKPQSAYYEMYGYEGVETLYETIKYAKEKGLYVIADIKRNDIGSTATAYAKAYLGKTQIENESLSAFDADSVTVNGYLGSDGITPFINECKQNNKTMFVLVKTSNSSSGELQDLFLYDNNQVYLKMAKLVENWGKDTIGKNGYSQVGAVVGATYPEQLKELRGQFKNMFFLVPGYGAQGGGASDVTCGFDSNGLGAIINSSRAVMCAYKKEGCAEEDFAGAARREALKMKKELNEAKEKCRM